MEVETTHESNSAFSTVCPTLSLTLLALENGGARSSLSVSFVVSSSRYKVASAPETRVHVESREKSRVYASIVRDVLDLTNFRRITIDRKGLDKKTTKNGLGKIRYVSFYRL